MKINNTTGLIYTTLIKYKIKYGLIKGIYKFLIAFYNGDFYEEKVKIIKKRKKH